MAPLLAIAESSGESSKFKMGIHEEGGKLDLAVSA